MKQVSVKIDSKGRFYLPAEIRKELGSKVILKKNPQGYLITSKQYVAVEDLRK